MRDLRTLKKSDLLAALAELVDVDPEEYLPTGARCHHCLADEGHLHRGDCPWISAAIVCRGDAAIARRRVGEDEEDFDERSEDDEEFEEPFDRAAAATSARAELAALLGGSPPDVSVVPSDAEILGDPLDEPVAWDEDPKT